MTIKGSHPFEAGTIVDSRDMVERVSYLESLAEYDNEGNLTSDGLDDDEHNELTMLRDALEEIGSEATDGVTLIRDDYFEDYAQQYAEDMGAIGRDVSWPATHIDWEAAANDLQTDYTSVEIDRDTYWYR